MTLRASYPGVVFALGVVVALSPFACNEVPPGPGLPPPHATGGAAVATGGAGGSSTGGARPPSGGSPANDANDAGDAPDAKPDAPDVAPPADGSPPDQGTTDGAAAELPVRDAAVTTDGPSSARQIARPLGTTKAAQGFHEYLPPGYGDGRKHPLLVFMHGVGENGNGTTTLDRVLMHGPPKIIRQNQWPAERPFIVLSPQQPTNCPSAAQIDAFLKFALATYDVDERRIYLTGLSCGGIGSFAYLGQHRGALVAAAALVAGDGRAAFTAAGCALGEVAIWAFHGDRDDSVPVAGSTAPIASLMSCPSPPRKEAKLTIYPGVGHDSWTRTYDLSAGHDPYTWLLRFQR